MFLDLAHLQLAASLAAILGSLLVLAGMFLQPAKRRHLAMAVMHSQMAASGPGQAGNLASHITSLARIKTVQASGTALLSVGTIGHAALMMA